MGSPVLGCELEEIKKASFEASIIFLKSGGGGEGGLIYSVILDFVLVRHYNKLQKI